MTKSLFSKIKEETFSDIQLNHDLNKVCKWAFQWKMLFNPDPNQQAIEICFSHKTRQWKLPFIGVTKLQLTTSQKHLGLILNSRLDVNELTCNKINKCTKIISVIKRLSLILPRKILLIYKSFVTSNPDYADIIYDKHFNESFIRKIKMVQYKAALVITGAIKGTSRDRP